MIIKKARIEDLQEILNLQYLAYQSEAKLFNDYNIPPLKQTFSDMLADYQKGVILKALEESNKIIGSVRGYLCNGTVHIGKLFVHPEKQGQGIGSKLLMAIEDEFPNQRYELFTSTRSKKNIELYQKLGYTIFNEKRISKELVFVYLEKSICL